MPDREFAPFQAVGDQGHDPSVIREAVATIVARDPLFNLDTFLAEAQQAFWLVGQAHAKCKPDLSQAVLSPALADRERAAIEQSCREGKNSAPGDADAESGRLLSIASDASHDTVVVHFTSVWRDVSGGRHKEDRRVQNWCFQRPAGVRTAQAAGSGDRCATCGALLAKSAGGTCRYCGAIVGAGDGWRIIRIDDVEADEAASALSAMQAMIAGMAAAAAAARQQAGTPGSAPTASTPASRRSPRGCLFPLVVIIVIAAGLGAAAVGGTGTWHRDVAKFFPSIRHPQLRGPLDLSGTIVGQHLVATQVPPRFQTGGTCAKEAIRTAWDFKTKLPDGSTFRVEVGLPPGAGAPGTYQRPVLSLTANAQNASRYESWTATTKTTAVLVVQAGGGGDLQFSALPLDQGGTSSLSGHLAWACALA